MAIHYRHIDDTITTMATQLTQLNAAGVATAVDLTGLTVKFKLDDSRGTAVIAETETGVTVTDASDGDVEYDFLAADVDTAGDYVGYFLVYNGAEVSTFPVQESGLIITIFGD